MRRTLPSRVDRERGAVEHHLVLAADQVRIQHRQAACPCARSAMRASRSPPLPRWKGDALSTHSTCAPAARAERAGSSNQASSQISTPTRDAVHLEHQRRLPASRPDAK